MKLSHLIAAIFSVNYEARSSFESGIQTDRFEERGEDVK